MRALAFDGRTVGFKQYHAEPAFDAAGDEAIIQTHLAGICQTDLEIARGYMGFAGILGHEFVGTVVKARDPRWMGKRVVGEINCVCSKCDMCLHGLSSHCRNRTVLGIVNRNGAFADYVALPMRNLHEVPANVSDEEAVFTEPLAAAVQVLKQVPVDARTRATVLGDGRLGQLVAQVLKTTGCQLVLVGRHASKLAVAERVGIRTALAGDVAARKDQDVVVDCTGRIEGLEHALQLVRPRGTLVMKTTVASDKPMNLAAVVIDEITVLGSRCGPFREALQMLATRKVDVSGLISRRCRIDQAQGWFAGQMGPDTLKVLISFDR